MGELGPPNMAPFGANLAPQRLSLSFRGSDRASQPVGGNRSSLIFAIATIDGHSSFISSPQVAPPKLLTMAEGGLEVTGSPSPAPTILNITESIIEAELAEEERKLSQIRWELQSLGSPSH